MKRKTVLLVAALLIVFDIGFTAVVVEGSAHRVSAVQQGIATVVAFVGEHIRPLPKLD